MRIKSEHSKIVKKNGGQSHVGSGSEFFSLSDERSGKPSGSDSSSENADSLSSSEVSENIQTPSSILGPKRGANPADKSTQARMALAWTFSI